MRIYRPEDGPLYGSNFTDKPIDPTPTLRVMPRSDEPVDIGEPDVNAGKGCLK